MDNREDLASILPFLPVLLRSSSLSWPPQVVEALKALSSGPHHSSIDSGVLLFLAISDIRSSLSLSSQRLASSAADGYALFFDDLMSRDEAKRWFADVIPAMANLLLQLPSLLEAHYQSADSLLNGVQTGLRLLNSQQAGIVFLSQELIGALLACSFFCLFPISNRGAKHLPKINFDHLFASLYDSYDEKQENKIKCIIHYFKRICLCMPMFYVSFERKVLPLEHGPLGVSYPKADFWSKSVVPLCRFEVFRLGLLEDQASEALEVDFANKYIGGGALHRGCVQEEIRFMINPELIVGMLFLPSMEDNEAIEIFGAERFSNYTGYASSFRFSGDHVDNREVDSMGRRKTRIIAIDALSSPRQRQYGLECLLREINKAFCGFSDLSKFHRRQKLFENDGCCSTQVDQDLGGPNCISTDYLLALSSSMETKEGISGSQRIRNPEKDSRYLVCQDDIGIVTGNWGCGAFGGDPELKSIIQWLAASQALRPFISYFTFGEAALQTLDQVSRWILLHEWTVGELWNMLVEYSSQRLKGKTNLGFFTWLLPTHTAYDSQMCDIR
ncbi:poly(ADP-ribose) glycohydrolase 1 isoform X2 [Malania oleifera]|uniref:poly(ADP-ribose) glycohydrolase 1 isoform X2 n=1 Tax=Malania oleifera TaxID=397392 RepID=UPI0025ADDB8A|nr:poly(ADP-ribose) glycohydrolase 1 isoform X2 [Malania oleifera]